MNGDGDMDGDRGSTLCSLPCAAALQLLPVHRNPPLPKQTAQTNPAPAACNGLVVAELRFPREG